MLDSNGLLAYILGMLNFFTPCAPLRWSWLTMIGPDAQDFLHRLTSANVRSLVAGRGMKACFLTGEGRIRGYFRLWHFGAESVGEYALEFEAGANDRVKRGLLEFIDQYTFNENFTVFDVSGTCEFESRWLFANEDDESRKKLLEVLGVSSFEPGETLALDEEIRICHHGPRDFGRTWISAWGRPARIQQWIEQKIRPHAAEIDLSTTELWRVLSLSPRADVEITEETNPLELGLAEAVSRDKGCYPGQEVLERIVSSGSPARRLAMIEGEGNLPEPGDVIVSDPGPEASSTEIGEFTTVVKIPELPGFVALGLVRKIYAKQGFQVRFGPLLNPAVITRIAPYA